MGVHVAYTDGLGRPVKVGAETLFRVCTALGAEMSRSDQAAEALRAWEDAQKASLLPPVLVAWDGRLAPLTLPEKAGDRELRLEEGTVVPLVRSGKTVHPGEELPPGYHTLTVSARGRAATCTVISAPVKSWRRDGEHRSWGLGAQLAALRSRRSRALGDLRDLETLCQWVHRRGGDLVTVLPLLPTFNTPPAEPSPYSPVSRLFWSELVLDLGKAHRPVPLPHTYLDVTAADVEVRAAVAAVPAPPIADAELARYARFRGAQARLGRNWRDWPAPARDGTLAEAEVDREEERFHLVAQTMVREQLRGLRDRLEHDGMRLGLDLAVGVHPDGYDPWSRQALFADGMSVGAPPDYGFPSGQDWGFSPVMPEASRRDGHAYVAGSVAHQATLAGLLRVDHIMACTRLYWIPHGMRLHEGTYVSYPSEEMFAVLTLESHRHRCEIVGENLGTVPPAVNRALRRHGIRGMYLAQFEAAGGRTMRGPSKVDIALIGTHDTPTFAGWFAAGDVAHRVKHRLLAESAVPAVMKERKAATRRLRLQLGTARTPLRVLLARLLEWLGRSDSTLVVPWLEDLWLEAGGVNLPGTRSSEHPNWQRPMRRLLDDVTTDPEVASMVARLHRARIRRQPSRPATP